MKKLFRRKELGAPGYPTHEAVGVSSRAVAVAGLLVAATTTAGCLVASTGPDEPGAYARDAGTDAGRDAEFISPPGGGAPLPEPVDAGE